MIHPPTKIESSLITNAQGHRREPRFHLPLPATLWLGRDRHPFIIEDVSATGLFVTGAARLRARQLVRVEMRLLPKDQSFVAHGMVVHEIPEDNPFGRLPGYGIQLYALDRIARGLWADFVGYVRWQCPVGDEEILFDEPLILGGEPSNDR